MRLLRVLRLGLVNARLLGHLLRSVKPGGDLADLLHRLCRQRHRVGAHVGDEADAALADVHTLIELLREPHGAPRIEAEFARRLLLQGRGRERRRRVAAALLAVDGDDLEKAVTVDAAGGLRRGFEGALGRARRALVGEGELLDLAAAVLEHFQRKRLPAVRALGIERPVLLRLEGVDLLLALADHAQRRALHPARRQAATHFLPQQRREIEAHQVVERAARLLRVDQIERQAARLLHGGADGVARDLVEHHAMHLLAVEVAALREDLLQVPGDRLALAVGVGGEVERVGFPQRARDGIHVALVLLQHLVLHGVAVGGIDRALFRHQVAHVAVGGEHLERAAQVLLDGPGLGGRLDDDEVGCH